MTLAKRFLPTFTIMMTSLAPLFFAFLLVGCNFQKEEPQITLEIPSGYAPASAAKQRTWEEVAAAAQKLALDGPAVEMPTMPVLANPATTTPVAQAKAPAAAPKKMLSKKLLAVQKRRLGRKKLAMGPKKYWKPVRLVSRAH